MSPIEFGRQLFNRSQGVEPTLNVRFSGGRTVVFIVLLILAFSLAGEVFVRLNAERLIVGVPGVGSRDQIFESRLSLLDSYAAGRESIDCVTFGDSTMMTDYARFPFQVSFR
jgi:hypothetical protein